VTRLLIASAGGHLSELILLAPRLWPTAEDELWVTFDSVQSRALLANRRTRLIRNTAPRDWLSVALNARVARRLLSEENVQTVVSTGAGVALSFLTMARAKGIAAHYIESAARAEAPSLSGRILERVHGVQLYTQHRELADQRWRYAGSVFEGFQAVGVCAAPPPELRHVFITVGMRDFSFIGLFERLRAVLPANIDVVVQAGFDARRLDWPGARVRSEMSTDELRAAMAEADAVVAHAGVGSILAALGAGKVPILVPRRHGRGEHVDDHQTQIARRLADHDLAIVADSRTIGLEHFSEALTRSVKREAVDSRFILQ
jgi:UDP-N-acetylglucosamine--N-acetylmuramyl-(pentapeptide) pyrophosphoryl-undecaprenol N-acetylglucosamine transferase